MSAEEFKEKKDVGACFNAEHFQNMFEMMHKCFKGEGSFDCSIIMKAMKNQSCCGSEKNKQTACC